MHFPPRAPFACLFICSKDSLRRGAGGGGWGGARAQPAVPGAGSRGGGADRPPEPDQPRPAPGPGRPRRALPDPSRSPTPPSPGFYPLLSPRLASPLSPGRDRAAAPAAPRRPRRPAVFPHRGQGLSRGPSPPVRGSGRPHTGSSGEDGVRGLAGAPGEGGTDGGRGGGTVPLAERLSGYFLRVGGVGAGLGEVGLIFPAFD